MEKKLFLENFLLRKSDVFYMQDTTFWSDDLSSRKTSHTHDFYEFFFVIDGQVTECINGTEQAVSEKEIRILFPKDCHCVFASTDYKTSKIRNIAIRSDYFEDRLARISCNANEIDKRFSLGYFAYNALIEETNAAQKYIHDPKKYYFIMANVLDSVLIHACISNKNETKIPFWLKQLCTDMQATENYVQGLPRMLELACKSQGYLNRCMKKYLGVTSTEYINTLRLNGAAELLRSTDKKVVDIAYECGFESVPYFNKIFKKQFEITPHLYRRYRIC